MRYKIQLYGMQNDEGLEAGRQLFARVTYGESGNERIEYYKIEENNCENIQEYEWSQEDKSLTATSAYSFRDGEEVKQLQEEVKRNILREKTELLNREQIFKDKVSRAFDKISWQNQDDDSSSEGKSSSDGESEDFIIENNDDNKNEIFLDVDGSFDEEPVDKIKPVDEIKKAKDKFRNKFSEFKKLEGEIKGTKNNIDNITRRTYEDRRRDFREALKACSEVEKTFNQQRQALENRIDNLSAQRALLEKTVEKRDDRYGDLKERHDNLAAELESIEGTVQQHIEGEVQAAVEELEAVEREMQALQDEQQKAQGTLNNLDREIQTLKKNIESLGESYRKNVYIDEQTSARGQVYKASRMVLVSEQNLTNTLEDLTKKQKDASEVLVELQQIHLELLQIQIKEEQGKQNDLNEKISDVKHEINHLEREKRQLESEQKAIREAGRLLENSPPESLSQWVNSEKARLNELEKRVNKGIKAKDKKLLDLKGQHIQLKRDLKVARLKETNLKNEKSSIKGSDFYEGNVIRYAVANEKLTREIDELKNKTERRRDKQRVLSEEYNKKIGEIDNLGSSCIKFSGEGNKIHDIHQKFEKNEKSEIWQDNITTLDDEIQQSRGEVDKILKARGSLYILPNGLVAYKEQDTLWVVGKVNTVKRPSGEPNLIDMEITYDPSPYEKLKGSHQINNAIEIHPNNVNNKGKLGDTSFRLPRNDDKVWNFYTNYAAQVYFLPNGYAAFQKLTQDGQRRPLQWIGKYYEAKDPDTDEERFYIDPNVVLPKFPPTYFFDYLEKQKRFVSVCSFEQVQKGIKLTKEVSEKLVRDYNIYEKKEAAVISRSAKGPKTFEELHAWRGPLEKEGWVIEKGFGESKVPTLLDSTKVYELSKDKVTVKYDVTANTYSLPSYQNIDIPALDKLVQAAANLNPKPDELIVLYHPKKEVVDQMRDIYMGRNPGAKNVTCTMDYDEYLRLTGNAPPGALKTPEKQESKKQTLKTEDDAKKTTEKVNKEEKVLKTGLDKPEANKSEKIQEDKDSSNNRRNSI